jgi:hypothetical protein
VRKFPLRRRMAAEWGLDIDGVFVPWQLLDDLRKEKTFLITDPAMARVMVANSLAEHDVRGGYHRGPELEELMDSYGGDDWGAPEDQLITQLAALQINAGSPSSRTIAAGVGGISHTTANNALRGHKFPSWEVMRRIITYLGGNPEDYLPLWNQARGERKIGG